MGAPRQAAVSTLRAVLDTNVVLSGLMRPQGTPGRILTALLEAEAFEAVASEPMLVELSRALRYPKVRRLLSFSDEALDLWVDAYRLTAHTVAGDVRIEGISPDPADDMFLAAAVEGLAGFVVSGDTDLLGLKVHEGVRILTPREFLDLLEEERPR